MNQVRVRFAPSPTGYLHVGGARTAIFNWLFARKHGGVFVLRIEDTDRERSSEEMIRYILDGLAWLGVDWDEGPIFQGARAETHRAYAHLLLEKGAAYRCFCTAGEAETLRARALEEKSHGAVRCGCRDLDAKEAERRSAAEPFALRFRTPADEEIAFEDGVYGSTSKRGADIEDFVLLRSDGSPTYHLSVVVDDAEMGITHVIRGQDHLSNTPKQILLYRAMGYEVPFFAHLPLLLAPNKGKLSKRKHGEIVSLTTYRDRGFLPEAFLNFLALLGWSPGDDREKLSRKELIRAFELAGVNKSNAIFNFREGDERAWTDPKALALNAEYINDLSPEALAKTAKPFLERAGLWRPEYEEGRADWFRRTAVLLRDRFQTLQDFAGRGRPWFTDDFPMEESAVRKNLEKNADALRGLLPEFAERLEGVEPFDAATVEGVSRAFWEEKGLKPGLVMNACRAAITGASAGPSMFEVFETIGRERSVRRIRKAAAAL
ncbi:MAG: glutamate--tRNA ligase [Candidatus Eisenbacteria bacterium]|nr:glutamate--tRNA ligase [Candidatus Eisenbacteria bacterium]